MISDNNLLNPIIISINRAISLEQWSSNWGTRTPRGTQGRSHRSG